MKNSLFSPLLAGQVDIWQADLTNYAAKSAEFYALLSPVEKARADRFKFAQHRQRFIIAKAILRIILSRYLDIDTKVIDFYFNAHGKPYLLNEISRGLFFNLSHAEDKAIYAIAYEKEVGVDIEYIKPDFSGKEIAGRFFSEHEKKALAALPSEVQQQAFFNLWTRKEAFLKCLGEGLSFPLNKFSISIEPTNASFIELPQQQAEQQWSIFNLLAPDSYAAALVVAGKVEKLNFCSCNLN